MSLKDSIRIVPQSGAFSAVAVVEMDMVGEKVNKLSTPMMFRLKEVLTELKSSSYKGIIFISKKPRIFVAGADIEEIKTMKTKEEFDRAVEGGQSIFNLLEDLPQITMASVHGACAGGGCEMILACDYRIASDDSSTRIGLPETQLGILPGFGGCVRLPRVIGLTASLDVILAGKLLNAKKAQKAGLVDRLVHEKTLLSESLKWMNQMISEGKGKRRKQFKPQGLVPQILEGPLGRPVVFSKARQGVMKQTRGHYPAPLKALEVIQKTFGSSDREKSLRIEREAFCECAVTDISKNLIHVFFLTEMVKKQNGVPGVNVQPKEVKGLGILGAGTMGGGIAYIAADKGLHVRMKDLSWEALGKGFKHAQELWGKLAKKKVIDAYQFKQKMNLITGGVDFAGFKNLDVVVEAIVEDMAIKQKVIGETAAQMRVDAMIATNTSSLSVTEMAKGHPRPENFAGMHFFNPVHKMPLVEVIRGERTSDETIATIFELSKKMGKMPVVVKDGPGFLVNRLLLPYMAEAAFLLQEGMAIDQVDEAYVQDFGMPMGPFALMDEVGLDVCIKVLKIFKKAFSDRIEIAPLMEKLATSGRLGKKNGKGFYLYPQDSQRGTVDPSIYTELGLSSPSNPYSTEECIERGVFAMVNECSLALFQDRIVNSAAEVDLAMIMGTGFPPFRGGLLRYADRVGVSSIVEKLNHYKEARKASRLQASSVLKEMAASKKSFYSSN